MALASTQFQLPDELKDAILSENCVAFIGSGLSAGSYDSWPDLVNALCERCGSSAHVKRGSPSDALLDAAQAARDTNEGMYLSFLGEHFGRPARHAALLYDALLSLPFECYLTVNIDPLLALKARTAKIPCDVDVIKAYPSLDRKAMRNRSIHYLHGLITEGSTPARGTIVLARGEFDAAYEDNSTVMNLLVPTLENDPVVFVGCRLREPVMSHVFSICKQHQQARLRAAVELGQPASNPPRRFILLPQPAVRESEDTVNPQQSRAAVEKAVEKEEAYYGEMDIKSVWYPASGGDHSELRVALERLAGLPEISPDYGWEGGEDVD